MIQKVLPGNENEVHEIYTQCKERLDELGIYQWLAGYPTIQNANNDIEEGTLYGYVDDMGKYKGVITLSQEQAEAYKNIEWADSNGRALVVHRLAILPQYWQHGIGGALMEYAEKLALNEGYTSIRLDAYSDNKRSLKLYESMGYTIRGEVYFEGRKNHFYCFEKQILSQIITDSSNSRA